MGLLEAVKPPKLIQNMTLRETKQSAVLVLLIVIPASESYAVQSPKVPSTRDDNQVDRHSEDFAQGYSGPTITI